MAGPSARGELMSVYDVVKQIALDELRAKGYAPNPADVVGIAAQVAKLVEEEVVKALAETKTTVPTPVVKPPA
jgi:hypothetical protein